MHRHWLVNRTNQEYLKYLSKSASISPVLAQILVNRGIKTAGDISSFLNSDILQLSDPFDIQGMGTAVDRIIAASKRRENILVHGDYDVDGLTSTAIVLKALKILGIESDYFIPNRMEHGYGFNKPSIKRAKQVGATLIITVDCGITSFETVSLCKKEGIDVIITDHHEPLISHESAVSRQQAAGNSQEFLFPDAVAVINPKISNLESPVSNLSGAGIAFKLAQALLTHDSRFTSHDFLDLAALGTIADVVPITGENRLIVKEGLKLIENGASHGLQALKKVSGTDGKGLKTGLLLFTIIPRINASGRVSDANRVVKFLLTGSEDEAIEMASWLEGLNSERQKIEKEVYQEALYQLNNKGVNSVIVLSSEGWHRGVIGIVASRIAEVFYRPAFIISVDGHVARGSARSIPNFDIYKALAQCRNVLRGFGGHRQAAGLELDSKNISSFEEHINRIANETLTGKDFIPQLEIDANINFSDLNFNLIREFEMLEPFGSGNPEPLLGAKGLDILYPRILKDNHLKMNLRQKNISFDAIGFNMASYFDKIGTSIKVDAVFTPCFNDWEGFRSLQLNLKALRPSQ
ncbi:MAG: single-stranded-DNA-specific exonuclease RecJ [Nitrospirae bacterium]|nr:single-stranded-DNA-specific exonuclease RecJ [Nitrospirota bacterium]